MKHLIKPTDQEDVMAMYWQLLGAVESKAVNPLDKALVTAAYDQLNRIGYSKHRPSWEKEAVSA